jgi:hypothetical protein
VVRADAPWLSQVEAPILMTTSLEQLLALLGETERCVCSVLGGMGGGSGVLGRGGRLSGVGAERTGWGLEPAVGSAAVRLCLVCLCHCTACHAA